MGEGTVFSLFVSPHLDGEGAHHPRSGQGGYPIQGPGGGAPSSCGVTHPADGGYPIPGLNGEYSGYNPWQELDGVPPSQN